MGVAGRINARRRNEGVAYHAWFQKSSGEGNSAPRRACAGAGWASQRTPSTACRETSEVTKNMISTFVEVVSDTLRVLLGLAE